MAKYVLTVRSRSGKRLNGCTGSSTSVAVYSDDELKTRLAAVKKHPDYAVTVKKN